MTFEEVWREYLTKPLHHPFHGDTKKLALHFFQKGKEEALGTGLRTFVSYEDGTGEMTTRWPDPRTDQ